MLRQSVSMCLACEFFACGPSFTQTGPKLPPRADDCEFQVLTATPKDFTELGVFEIPGYKNYTVAALHHDIQEDVCRAGADAVIWIDGASNVTVVKLAPPAARGDSSGGSAVGCQFDNQCKGDRVCVKGECVAPGK